jgi:diguanylate cyclase (GGDEF)-like protein
MFKPYQLAQTDPLTGLANRLLFEKTLRRELSAIRHSDLPLSILLVDADHFRQFVATYGKDNGNVAVRLLADTLRNRARRPRDLVAHITNDRFAVLLPETSAHAAAVISTALHVDLAGLPEKSETGLPANARLTVSIGIHTITRNGVNDATEAMNCVETALYQAKQLGHNRSFVYTENTTAPRPAS